jgi:hypothetical protein
MVSITPDHDPESLIECPLPVSRQRVMLHRVIEYGSLPLGVLLDIAPIWLQNYLSTEKKKKIAAIVLFIIFATLWSVARENMTKLLTDIGEYVLLPPS